jgi:hypothetical protein
MNTGPTLMVLMVAASLAACKPDYVDPGPTLLTESGGGYGETGDTDGPPNPHVCFDKDAPAEAVRWQCEGFAEAVVRFTVSDDAEIPDAVPDDLREFIQLILDYGRLDWYALFGPVSGEPYDDPGIDACCLPDIGGADAQDGADETGPPPEDEAWVPQPAMACADDCADQACRQAIREIRKQAELIPGALQVSGVSLRNQLIDISNWLATGQPCFDAMKAGGVSPGGNGYQISGTVELPTPDGRWPAFAEVSVAGKCTIYDWYLPAQGEPHTCMGINDNNHDEPFGSGGPSSNLGGFDTYAPVGGELRLDGPTILGIHAAGSAPILGLGDACPRGECSRVDAWITGEHLELRRIALVTPSAMSWEQDGMRLTVDGMHAIVEHPRTIPLTREGDVMRFELLAGELEVMLAGRVQGVPISLTVPNVTPVEGTVTPLPDGSHALAIAAFELEHRDAYGTWTMQVTLGPLIAVEHSPRARVTAHESPAGTWLDASASFDPDGDALAFEWILDGEVVGDAPVLMREPGLRSLPLALRVSDASGRSTWAMEGVAVH